jgi:geranylgeranyl transferase type-2 subunit alpha
MAALELNLIREALNVGPEDQSLWYYHQFLVLNLVDYTGRPTMVPNFAVEDRVTYVTREIEDIKDLLEDYDDIKWIYEALMEYTISVSQLEEREPQSEEKEDLKGWLAKLRELDPMRNGRWNDTEREYGLV